MDIRNYREEDFNNYLEFVMDTNTLDMTEIGITPTVLNENLKHPIRNPEKDIFIAENHGKIVGFCEIYPEVIIKRVLLDALVHPNYRRRGVASALIQKAYKRSFDLGAKCIHVDIPEKNIPARRFLIKQGFENIRCYLNMVLDLEPLNLEDTDACKFDIRPCRQGDERMLTEIQNHCFKDSWGFKPNTVEEVDYLINACGCSPEDVIFCFEGDKPVGYCWTKVNREENKKLKDKKGRIHMLGIDPDYRGYGLGRGALLQGLRYLKSQGILFVELTTDKENQVAFELYQSMGFKQQSTLLWYEKPMTSRRGIFR